MPRQRRSLQALTRRGITVAQSNRGGNTTGNDGIIRGRSRYRFQFDQSRTNDFAHGVISDRDAINLATRYRKYRSLTLDRLVPLKGHLWHVNMVYAVLTVILLRVYSSAISRMRIGIGRAMLSFSMRFVKRVLSPTTTPHPRERTGLSHAINSSSWAMRTLARYYA